MVVPACTRLISSARNTLGSVGTWFQQQPLCIASAGSTVNDDDSFPWARLDRNLLQCWVMQGRCPPPDDQHAAPDAIYAEVSPVCTCRSRLASSKEIGTAATELAHHHAPLLLILVTRAAFARSLAFYLHIASGIWLCPELSIEHVTFYVLRSTFRTWWLLQLQEADQVTRHLWIGGLAPGVDRGTLVNVAQAFGPLQDVTMVEGAPVAFVSFTNVQPACRAFELLDGQQVETAEDCTPWLHLLVLSCRCSVSCDQHLLQLAM